MIPKSSSVGIIYSDVNVTGFGGFLVQCGQEFVSESWSVMEMNTSSTFREILAVKFVLLSCLIIFQAFMDQTPSMHPPPPSHCVNSSNSHQMQGNLHSADVEFR